MRQRLFDLIDCVDHIGAGLALNLNKHRALCTQPTGERFVLGRDDSVTNVTNADRCAVAVSQDEIVEPARRRELIVRQEREGMLPAIERAFRLVDRSVCKRGADGLEVKPLRGKLRRIDLDPDGRVLLAADADESDAGHLREFLRKDAVGVIADFGKWKRIRSQRDEQDRRIGRVGLPIDRRIEQIGRQLPHRRVNRRLNVSGGRVDSAVAAELERDLHIAERAARRHLRKARNFTELTLERRRNGRCHRQRIGARQLRSDLDRRRIDFRQGRDRQKSIADDTQKNDRHHQQRRRDRPVDKGR